MNRDSAAGEKEIVDAIVEWLRNELEDFEVSEEDNFLDIGGHSLTFSKMNRYLGEKFGVSLDARKTYEGTLREAAIARRDTVAHQ
ncbi:acyl carrier protein [Actinopolyspora mortivallis]|uniref:Carrier domain-containing protein n=1 Tax=Actinopolyspora mortivallis TaxID=33906 RepID=A0A2T0GZW1_ACTMO|nr:acyl carrier protein [Actinopolyspora mortivallis]PRW64656.1 hypothetical protein CEP50_04735 [Actinopolyspora mortivallis]